MRRTSWCAVATATVMLAVPSAAAAAPKSAVIDFDSISAPQSPTGEGLIIDQLSSGNGISGDAVSGVVGVLGESMDPRISTNAALVFDATCSVDRANGVPEDCTGDDTDLFVPELKNVLIIAEDLIDVAGGGPNGRIDDPDDADLEGQNFQFDFAGLEGGSVKVESIDVVDVDDDETSGMIEFYDDGMLKGAVPIPLGGEGLVTTVTPNTEGVDAMKVILAGSAAIDNIRLEIGEDETLGAEGCTPGFWKTHPAAWTGLATTDKYNDVFGVTYMEITLMDAMWQGGGGFARLGRHSTAALLNALHAEVDYGITSTEVIELVQAAFASGDPGPAGDRLEALNERECGVESPGAADSTTGKPFKK